MVKKKRKKHKERKKEQTFIIIKPDGVQKKLISRILFRFENNGLHVKALKMLKVRRNLIEKLYAHLKYKLNPKLFNSICKWMSSSPVVVGVVEGAHSIQKARRLAGPTNPKEAHRGTIRGDFATDDLMRRARLNLPVRNIVHVSSSRSDARKELALFKSFIKVKY